MRSYLVAGLKNPKSNNNLDDKDNHLSQFIETKQKLFDYVGIKGSLDDYDNLKQLCQSLTCLTISIMYKRRDDFLSSTILDAIDNKNLESILSFKAYHDGDLGVSIPDIFEYDGEESETIFYDCSVAHYFLISVIDTKGYQEIIDNIDIANMFFKDKSSVLC